jgi:putative ABC transport system ATP-binding protein
LHSSLIYDKILSIIIPTLFFVSIQLAGRITTTHAKAAHAARGLLVLMHFVPALWLWQFSFEPLSISSTAKRRTQMAAPFIQITNLSKSYETPAGPLSVLGGIDLDIPKGDFIALVGPSGGGKTTFLNMITGVDRPSSGDVVVDGVDVAHTSERKLTRWRGRTVGIVFQFFQLLPTMTVLKNVVAPMDFCGVHKTSEREDKAMALLERFDVADQAHKTPDLLSGGQQQRVAIARALANDPQLVIGDEPTGNLDRMSAAVVFDTFYQMREEGHTIIVVTHDKELVRDVPTVLSIQDGLIESTTLEAAARRREREHQAQRLSEF